MLGLLCSAPLTAGDLGGLTIGLILREDKSSSLWPSLPPILCFFTCMHTKKHQFYVRHERSRLQTLDWVQVYRWDLIFIDATVDATCKLIIQCFSRRCVGSLWFRLAETWQTPTQCRCLKCKQMWFGKTCSGQNWILVKNKNICSGKFSIT